MSNRDGRGAKHRASHKIRRLKEGSPCPICSERSKSKGRTKVKVDKSGHSINQPYKSNTKLTHCDCGCRRKGSNNLFCATCHWSNF